MRARAARFRGESMKRLKLAIAVAAMALPATMLGQANHAVSGGDARSDRPAAAPQGTPSDYVIGADDTLHISVWKEPDLTETLPVRPDGKISMPLLGDVDAAGKTPLELGDSIRDRLKKYVSDPRVTVVVTAMNSQRIFITGEVNKPGAVPLLPHMTMLQALS